MKKLKIREKRLLIEIKYEHTLISLYEPLSQRRNSKKKNYNHHNKIKIK